MGSNALSLEELMDELQEQEQDSDFDLSLVAAWIRYSYGNGYRRALEDPEPDSLSVAKSRERAAWAQLP